MAGRWKSFSAALDNAAAGVEHGIDMSEWTAILDDLTTYLRWQQERGRRAEEIDPETLKAFLAGAPGKVAARNPAGTAVPPTTAAGQQAGAGLQQQAAARLLAAESRAPEAVTTPEARLAALAAIAQKAAACRLCVLCEKRTRAVPEQGNALSPDILFVGEAPDADEDTQGTAGGGAAGQLLTRMILAMGYTREEVFIANICKCCPPDNRHPTLDEMQTCLPYLRAQIAAIRPRTIVALGATAVKGLLDSSVGISKLRGTWTACAGIPLMPTYQPAYLLRFPQARKDAWDDLKKVLIKLGKPIPAKQTAK
ncbi:MAG: uracil-DNA glycosylase [bacterium]